MKRCERGFTLIELLVVIALIALLSSGAGVAVVQSITVTKSSNDHMTVIRQVQNAGYWISRDALMAENVIVDNLTPPSFLIITWTEWVYDGDSVYHSVTYSFQDPPDGIGKLLKRQYVIYDADGGEIGNTMTLVAEYIDSNPGATEASYTSPVLTVQITSSLGEANHTKGYTVWRRPNF